MNWVKEFDETDNSWCILNENGTCMFVFWSEGLADLMLFCLERAIA